MTSEISAVPAALVQDDEVTNSFELTASSGPAPIAVTEEAFWLANFTSKQTRKTYSEAITAAIQFFGVNSSDELYGISKAHVLAWREHLINSGMEPRSVSNRLSALSSLFKHLSEKQLVKENPVSGVKRPKTPSSRVATPAIAADDVRQMLEAPNRDTLQGKRDRALLHTFFYTGCRVSEVGRLKVKDLFQEQGYWMLDFQVKGGKRNRLAIHPNLYSCIQEYLDAADHTIEPERLIFQPVKNGKPDSPITSRQFARLFEKYASAIGLPRLSPHSARATFITEALDRGHPAEAVQKSVGHASITTTLSYDKRGFQPRESASFAVNY